MKDTTKQVIEILERHGYHLNIPGTHPIAFINNQDKDDECVMYDLGRISKECHEHLELYFESIKKQKENPDLAVHLLTDTNTGLNPSIVIMKPMPRFEGNPVPEKLIVESNPYTVESPDDGQNHGEVLGGLIDEATEEKNKMILEERKLKEEEVLKFLRQQNGLVRRRLHTGGSNLTPSKKNKKTKRRAQKQARRK